LVLTDTAEYRSAALAKEISLLTARGWRVETHDPFQAILVRGHLIERRSLIHVNEHGSLLITKLAVDRQRLLVISAIALVVVVVVVVNVWNSL
jgi:hypothetical protein